MELLQENFDGLSEKLQKQSVGQYSQIPIHILFRALSRIYSTLFFN